MKYVLLGTQAMVWVDRPAERTQFARAKLIELGITLEAAYYTRAVFDFFTVVDVPYPEALLAFTVWYSKRGFGYIEAIVAFTEDEMDRALTKI